MKKFHIDAEGKVEVYSEAKFRDILDEVWGKCEEFEHFNDDETGVHEEFVKLGRTVGAWHDNGGFGWIEMPHWLHGEPHIFF